MPNNIITTELYDTVAKNLSNKATQTQLKKDVGMYLDRYTDKLTTIGPVHRTLFIDSDKEKLYNAIGVTGPQIKAVLAKSPEVKQSGANMSEPFNTGCALAIRYFSEARNKEMVSVVLVYLTLSMYPSLHKKYYKYGMNEQIMAYTINNLSNKYIIKQKGNLYDSLVYTTSNTYILHENRLAKGTDKNYIDFILDVKTRQNSLMRKIAQEFFKNHESGHYLNSDGDSNDPDNFYEADSNTFNIERITNSVVLKLTVNGADIRYVDTAAKYCKISRTELRNYVNTMVTNDNREDIRKIAESILFLFIFDSKNTIQEVGSTKFLLYSLEVYKKSNTSDKNVIRIKEILDKWLEELGTYKKTQRLATINDFRRALFIFFVITIQRST